MKHRYSILCSFLIFMIIQFTSAFPALEQTTDNDCSSFGTHSYVTKQILVERSAFLDPVDPKFQHPSRPAPFLYVSSWIPKRTF